MKKAKAHLKWLSKAQFQSLSFEPTLYKARVGQKSWVVLKNANWAIK